jgi:hypothetical protein
MNLSGKIPGWCRFLRPFLQGPRNSGNQESWSATGGHTAPELGAIDPGLRGSLIAVGISACKENAAIAEPGFRHVVEFVVDLAGDDEKLSALWIEDF